jgi:hypothetical protein
VTDIRSDDQFRALFRPTNYGEGQGMLIVAGSASGRRVVYRMERVELPEFDAVEEGFALEIPTRMMRDLLQSMVDHAATMGIAAAGAPGTLRAKDENLADLRGIVRALLPHRSSEP